jgi:hypothetical protein
MSSETEEQCLHALKVGLDALQALKIEQLLDPAVCSFCSSSSDC